MIIDAVTFFNENDMLEFRLKLLYSKVDKFVIVEADKTFSGKDKPFNFDAKRFEWAADKIIHHKINIDTSSLNLTVKPETYDPTNDFWKIEYTQRDEILNAVKDFSDDDLLIMGDVDEIPSYEALDWAKNNTTALPAACQQDFYYYDLRSLRQEIWCGTIMATLRTARSLGTQELRNRRNFLPRMTQGGWHLSYFGGNDKIREKIESFSHQELNKDEFKSDDHISACRYTGKDLFNRPVEVTNLESGVFPIYFVERAKLYPWGIA